MAKYYFKDINSGNFYELSHHYEYMKKHGIKEMKVIEAERVTGSSYFYCQDFDDCMDKDDSDCGINCDSYIPKNGKSGICKHYGYTYEHTDKIKVLTLK